LFCRITSAQARIVSKVSELYAQGRLSVTTRQALQLHWLKTPSLPDMMRDLATESMSCFHGCGDVTRNVVCCPWAETCEFRRFNVRPAAKETADFLTNARDLDNLPRKFKVTFSGCPAGCAQPYINCIGAIAVQRTGADGKTEQGFKLVIGGGMGWKAFVAQELYSFVPRKKIARVCRGIAILFRDHGNRRDRTLSRLKFVVNRYGIDKCRELVNEALIAEGIDISDLQTGDFEETGVAFPDRPLAIADPVGTDGTAIVTAVIPKGELSHLEFKRLAQISEIFGNKRLYLTQRQNIEIHGVHVDKVAECRVAIVEAGFGTEGAEGIRDIVPCVGTTYCPKAVSKTRDMYDLLMALVQQPKYDAIWDRVTINITGCPNSCSPYRITDIGLRGMRIREGQGSAEGYEVRVGGTQEEFGRIVGDFKRDDCPVVVEKLLDTYMDVREGDETLAQCIQRIGWEA
jgi:sulfite reductase (ferredoxin)